MQDHDGAVIGLRITMGIGSKEYFFGASSRVDKHAGRITQFAVSLDIKATNGSVDPKVIVLGSISRIP
ncbi:hypothetical protein BGX87_13010 [Burkholderia ubonensis]|nr:hypothetical protein BGX87_13010 [Burkholderia ubonensis]